MTAATQAARFTKGQTVQMLLATKAWELVTITQVRADDSYRVEFSDGYRETVTGDILRKPRKARTAKAAVEKSARRAAKPVVVAKPEPRRILRHLDRRPVVESTGANLVRSILAAQAAGQSPRALVRAFLQEVRG